MTANRDLKRRLGDYYETEAPPVAPDWVLRDALATIDVTPQRRVFIRVPWRKFPTMNMYARLAVAAVAVIAIGAVALAVLRPGNSPGVGGQAVTPSPESSPSATSRPTPSPTSAPPMTQSFTSTLYGVSMSYPEGWTTQEATELWTGSQLNFGDPQGDFLYDPALEDHLFMSVASQPIGAATPDEWVADRLRIYECTDTEATVVDGATGLIGAGECNVAAVTTDGRGYAIALYTSGDEAWIGPAFDRAWFEEVLASVQLHPEDAVDTLP
jgi:hypothetical protein